MNTTAIANATLQFPVRAASDSSELLSSAGTSVCISGKHVNSAREAMISLKGRQCDPRSFKTE